MSSAPGATDLLAEGDRALQCSDPRGALQLYRRAEAAEPKNLLIKLQIALALRLAGDFEGALGPLDEALAIDPYSVMAHLSKGFVLEKLGLSRAAANAYKVALKCAPPDDRMPAALRAPLQKAREAVARTQDDLAARLKAVTDPIRARYLGEDFDRFERALEVYAGRRRVYYPEPDLINYPELPCEQFFGRRHFPWLEELETHTDIIREELMRVLEEDWAEFNPYIKYPAGAPVAQWYELNHSPKWSGFFLWEGGRKDEAHCARCPQTAALVERLPVSWQSGYAPTIMFSVLQPHTHIPPHSGSANTRLVVHLPLILPGQCRFRVGNDTREWKMGEAWVFDDTIEHEAWNDSDHVRVILMLDAWNPYLTEAERELVAAMMTAKNAWMAEERAR